MRTTLLTVLSALVLASGAAFAQSGWVGASAGAPGAHAHVGISDIGIDGLGVRANVGYAYVSPTGFELGADLIYAAPVDTGDVPATLYVGGGASTIIDTKFEIHGLAGAEILVQDLGLDLGGNDVGVFFEGGPSYGLEVYEGSTADDADDPTTGFGFIGRVGVNYHFDF